MPTAADLALLARARGRARDLDDRRRTLGAQIGAAEARRAGLVSSGAAEETIAPLTRRIEALHEERAEAARLLDEANGRTRRSVEDLAAREQPEASVGALEGQVPVALLPVRIEARFAEGGDVLHIRVFPDQAHVDAHEPELTDDEVAAGRVYWERRWAAPDDPDEARGAWATVAAGRRPTRARWIVEVTTPPGPPGSTPRPEHPDVRRRESTWTRPARAAALPTRWAAVGRRAGQELFRVWSGPVAEGLQVAPAPDDDAAEAGDAGLGEGLRWLTDPVAARRDGVMLTVRDTDLAGTARLRDGVDELVVLGVDWTRSPEEQAAELARLLAAHVYGDGLAFLAQGTPTNNTAEAAAGDGAGRAAVLDALDPALARPADAAWSAAPRLTAALGTPQAERALAGAPGAETADHAVSSALLDATWEATGGTYLGQLLRPVGRIRPMISDADIDQIRVWAAAHLFASGPLPLLRLGRQPYGVLPVVDPGRYRAPAGDRAAHLVQVATARARSWWERGAAAVPRLDTSPDPDATLVSLLQRSPVAASARFRRVFPPGVTANLVGLEDLTQQQGLHAWVVESMIEGRFSPRHLRIGTFTTDPRSHPLRVPWARPAGLEPGAALPYVDELRGLLGAPGGRDRLANRAGSTSLAEALLALTAALELDAAFGRVVRDFAVAEGAASPLVEAVRLRHPDTIGVGVEEPIGDSPLAFATPKVLADAVVPGLTGTLTVAEHVRGRLDDAGPAVDGLRRLRAALDRLRGEPGERVEWALRGLLDLYSHRLDAWCTALATQRLADVRRSRPDGVHVGCFGWVEDLRPDPPGRESLGYVHTPSVTHAVAAAVLRSGHVAHRSSAQPALAVDLSSGRVRRAMAVLDGVEGGQPLGALLGYRIERLLRERDATLTRYVLPLRRLAPIRHTDAELTEPVESIAARDVVDGVALLERWRAAGGREAVLGAAGVLAEDREAVAATLDAADDVFDAVGDVLLSEAVYQTVAGNQVRSRAALAALDRQERPVRPEVVRTPRSGTAVAHRLLVLLRQEVAPGWEGLSDPRGEAEPRLNAWLARLLGPPGSIVFAGEVRRGDAARATVTATAAELGLAPLGLALAARRASSDRPSELESRLAQVLAAKVPDGTDEDRLVLLPDGPGAWGLEAVRTVATLVERLAGRRPATAQDLHPLLHEQPTGDDVVELAARADRAVEALATTRAALEAAEGGGPGPALAALEQAARLGIADALPGATEGGTGARVTQVLAPVRTAEARLAEETVAFAERADPTPAQVVEHHLGRLRLVLGDGFPALPRFRVDEPGGALASLADRPALLGADELAPLSWLHRAALVRPDVEPLSSLLTVAEANGRDVGLPHLDVLQLPHEPGQRWVALPTPAGGEVPTGSVGIVVHAPDGLDLGEPVAGLVVDEWTEAIPAGTETTALSFHYDAPSAHPPQAVLLAVTGSADTARWSFDELLGAAREAIALTRVRAVTPQELPDLGGFLPALYVPQDVTGDVPAIDLFDLAGRAQRADVLPGVAGKG